MNTINSIATALHNLCPTGQFVAGATYEKTKWFSKDIPMPAKVVVLAEQARLLSEWQGKDYQRKRVAEYPPISDYVDGVVKGDTAQVQAYIDKCKAVKDKYPKPIK
jgi:hypothetical protein